MNVSHEIVQEFVLLLKICCGGHITGAIQLDVENFDISADETLEANPTLLDPKSAAKYIFCKTNNGIKILYIVSSFVRHF